MIMKQNLTVLMTAAAIATACSGADDKTFKTDTLGITVTPEENREYSYTDKKAGYWYGTTHQDSTEWWSGWNMAKKRILADLSIDLKPWSAPYILKGWNADGLMQKRPFIWLTKNLSCIWR